ncbi:ParB N-terminal domain-containing protein [Methanobrevibacter sp.]|uniref:ParB N-terminal domain-containing protein n=1 Tax=Methanobrevibacter sp. TaxID=66852 RepID=UPI0025FED827|nr:ParB N-terminal domain-containing protein [Methanobrevibacter sp.]MBQ2832338.1 ParB N-terminal domain-containing protein [Methanobrevibacter sp.]
MQIEKIKIIDISPAGYNPRTITDDEKTRLKNSIDNFGIVEPILINLQNENQIIGGHQRFQILWEQYLLDNDLYAELNLLKLNDSYGWVFPDNDITLDSEDMEKALNLVLNNTKVQGTFDGNKLVQIFNDLTESGFNTNITGFNNEDILGFQGLNEKATVEETSTTTEEDINLDTNMIIPEDEPEYDESIADGIETVTCPRCGYEIPKQDYSET